MEPRGRGGLSITGKENTENPKTISNTTSCAKTILILPTDLPKPFATPSVNNFPKIVSQPEGVKLHLPPGFKAEVYADGLTNPRWMTVASNGDVFVVESGQNQVTLLRDRKGNGKADFRSVFARHFNLPFGIAIWKDYLYVANTSSIVRFPYHVGQTQADGAPEKIVTGIPGYGYNQHWTRDLIFNAKNGKMYLSVGSANNTREDPLPRATIMEYNPDGSSSRIFASGLRNAVGKAFNPVTGEMWTTCNERDRIGDDLVPDFVTSIKDGGFYGWPYYYIGQNHDPRMPEKPLLKKKTIVPDVLLTSHSAPLGMAFYTGRQFPEEYWNDAFVALHGSTNRKKRTGYKIIRVPFKNGKPLGGYQDFMTGWMLGPDQKEVWGRPAGIVVAKDGSLLVADDGGKKIWRISYNSR